MCLLLLDDFDLLIQMLNDASVYMLSGFEFWVKKMHLLGEKHVFSMIQSLCRFFSSDSFG